MDHSEIGVTRMAKELASQYVHFFFSIEGIDWARILLISVRVDSLSKSSFQVRAQAVMPATWP